MKIKFFVIDTNTLISAFLTSNSKPKLAYDKAKELGFLVVSDATFDEFSEVFIRDKFDKFISLEIRLKIINEFKNLVVFLKTNETITACRDPKDNKFLELAVEANAACIITGDNDLLELHPFRNIPIVNAVDFLNMTV